jgi:uncharacterized protein
MATTSIPLFPLNLLPLPDELVPLHIFEPRYRQLIQDAEDFDVNFGIYCSHQLNNKHMGSIMRLESIIKRYNSGESDVVVRCVDIFTLDKMYRTHKAKLYPGGDILRWNVNNLEMADASTYQLFLEYQEKRKINSHPMVFSLYQMAFELNFDLYERYRFLAANHNGKISFIQRQLQFQLHVLKQEEKTRNSYHLN